MKLSKETVAVLENFAAIHPTILFRPGNVLTTMNHSKAVFGIAKVAETFQSEAGIYDLNMFLGTSSLIDDPDFQFGQKYVTIADEANETRILYVLTDPKSLLVPPAAAPQLKDIRESFNLTDAMIKAVLKATQVLNVPHVVINGDGCTLTISASDAANSSMNEWQKVIGKTSNTFRLIFRKEYFKMLPRDYNVDVTNRLIARFASTTGDVEYVVATETNSTKFSD